MNAIDKTSVRLKAEGRIGLMTHVVVGYPSLLETLKIARVMAEAGADFIELQIPFSDPMADGPTIMKACEASLAGGTRVQDAFAVAMALCKKISAPLLLMAYYNTVFKYGVRRFCRDARRAGISGLIVPDMSLEEEVREHFSAHAKKNNLLVIRVVAPASTEARLRKNSAVAEGFVYCSARQGITGAKRELAPDLADYLKTVRRIFAVPVAVGFGISKPEHVKKLSRYADIAVVGSAIIDIINRSNPRTLVSNVRRFVIALKKG